MGHKLIDELRAARRAKGWSQRVLAEIANRDPQQIKRLEQGIGSVATLLGVMKALDFRLTGLAPGRSLAEQLRARRLTVGLSVSRVASKAGLSRTTVDVLEGGGGSVASLLRLLAVIAPKARRRAPERAYWGEGDKADRDSRFTPPEFMASVYAAFGDIDLDPCAHPLSPVIAHRRILPDQGGDGLSEDWSGRLAYVNPPFSEMLRWLTRAHHQWAACNVQTVVCLAPARTDSRWFHEVLSAAADIYLLKGRLQFLDPRGKKQHTPFALMVVLLGATEEQKACFAKLVPGLWLGAGAMDSAGE